VCFIPQAASAAGDYFGRVSNVGCSAIFSGCSVRAKRPISLSVMVGAFCTASVIVTMLAMTAQLGSSIRNHGQNCFDQWRFAGVSVGIRVIVCILYLWRTRAAIAGVTVVC